MTFGASAAKRTAQTLLLAAAYYALARAGLHFQFANSQATPVWPPSGLALAAVLLWGWRANGGIFLGALCANLADFYVKSGGGELVQPAALIQLFSVHPEYLPVGAAIAAGNLFEALAGAWLILRARPNGEIFGDIRGVLAFCLSSLAASGVSSTVGVSSLLAGGVLPSAVSETVWLTWWLGDVTGMLIFTPFLITWRSLNLARLNTSSILLGAAALGILFLSAQMIFSGWFDIAILKRAVYIIFPILLLIAFRFGSVAATAGIVIASVCAILATLGGIGPFARDDQNETLIVLEGFVSVVSVTVLLVNATNAERGRALATSMLALAQFRTLFDGAPNGVMAVDGTGAILLLNAAAKEMFGYRRRDDLAGQQIEVLVPERLREPHGRLRIDYAKSPEARPMGAGRELFGRRRDGTEFPIEIGLNPVTGSAGEMLLVTVQDITERKQAEREQRELRRRMVNAIYAERLHLAHELHDQAGQSLTVVMLELRRLEAELSEDGRDRLRRMRKQLEELGKTLHRIAWEARPASIDELGLASALADYIAEWSEQVGIEADFHCSVDRLDGLVDDDARTIVYRVIQEALTNVAKHAAGATSVSVVVGRVQNVLRVTIEDNGCGFDTVAVIPRRPGVRAGGGLGIVGMRERLTLVLGDFEIESSPGVGTTIFLSIPLEREASAA